MENERKKMREEEGKGTGRLGVLVSGKEKNGRRNGRKKVGKKGKKGRDGENL